MACSLVLLLLLQPDPGALADLYRQALAERERLHGPSDPRVARASSDLGLFLRNHGDPAGAAPYLRRAAEIVASGENLENLASVLPPPEAIPVLRRAAESKDTGAAARALAKLGSFEEAQGNREAALVLYRQSLAKEPQGPRAAARLNDIALLLPPKEAEPLLRRALTMQEKWHPETAATLNNLANVLLATGRIAQAEVHARRALSMLESTLGPNHPRVATAASNLADALRTRRDYAGAKRLYERALAIDEKAYGPNHPEVAADRDNLKSLLEEIKGAR